MLFKPKELSSTMIRQINADILLLLLVCGLAYSQTDPCDSHYSIPDIHRRGAAYTLTSGETSINDRELVAGWYGDKNWTLLNKAPGFFKCGGWYPIWRSASDAHGQTSSMCVQSANSDCSAKFDINMKTCNNGYEVYYLPEAPVHRAVYCFEVNDNIPPTFKVKPVVIVGLLHETSVSKLLFHCKFSRSSEELMYITIWYVDGAPLYTFGPIKWTSDSFDYISNTTLTEKLLMDKGVTKAGFNLRCAVRAQYRPNSASSVGELSDNKFVGVKIHHWEKYVIAEGEERQLNVSLSVPFGCGNVLQNQTCYFDLEVVVVKNPDDCASAVVTQSSCGIQPIVANEWEKPSYLTFVGKTTSTYGETTSVAHLKLKTPNTTTDLSLLSPLWHNYEIGHVSIQIVKNTSSITSKSCASENDPYEKTFDGRWYSLDVAGVFTMYEDKNNQIEIQIETSGCYQESVASQNQWPFCTCGLAVRAGKTVFEISHCHSLTWTIGYTACGDHGDVLQVRRKWNEYMITLPTGTSIYTYVEGYYGLLNIYLYPTVLDEGKSRGLCGVLSSTPNDDFVQGNDELTNSPDEFAESWRVQDGHNLFDPEVVKNGFTSFKPAYQYCTCQVSSPNDKTIICSARAATEVCQTPKGFDEVKSKECAVSERKKRMAQYQPKRARRQTNAQQTWRNGWNESAATSYCKSQFAQSSSVQIVNGVPGVDVTGMMKECVEDIKKSGGTDFTAMSIASVQMMALREAMVNPVLSETDPNNPNAPSVFDKITLTTCPGDCNGRGICNQGKCQCNSGYGGGDCSVDLAMPPVVYDAGNGGHCDLASELCSHTAVIGNVFSGHDDAKCRIEKTTIKPNGETKKVVITSSLAVLESISEVECTLPEVDVDDIVVAFSISVSHAGDVYSNDLPLLVYDSSCITVNPDSREWALQKDYCTYKGKCHRIGSLRGDNPCLVCERNGGAQAWIQSNESGCPDGKLSIGIGNSARELDVSQTRQAVILLLLCIAANLY